MVRKLILASLMTAVSLTSFAGEQLWDFTNLGINSTGNGYEHSVSSGLGMTVNISAWSSTGKGCGKVNGNGNLKDKDSCIQDARLKSYGGGLGIQNRDEKNNSPNHAIDNTNKKNRKNKELDFDMVLLTFTEAVKITGFGSGWEGNDNESSVLAFTGNSAFTDFTGFGKKSNWSDILGQGWELIDEDTQNTIGGTAGSREFSVDDKSIHSKHWLVGTYNSAFSTQTWTDYNDAFKLSALTVLTKDEDTSNSEVSAPATAGLLFVLVALMMYRRKI